jgi:exonuclease III
LSILISLSSSSQNLNNANNIINTCTLNVNGLLDNYCQYSLKCFCLQNNRDILFLQETHVSNLKKVNELNDYFDMY